jgi:antitoxin Phd
MKNIQKIQNARNRLSEVVEQALRQGPRTITRRRKSTAAANEGDLVDFFRRSPLRGADLDLERKSHFGQAAERAQPG